MTTKSTPPKSRGRSGPRFDRLPDGSARIRLKFTRDEVDNMERVAGERDIADLLHHWIKLGVGQALATKNWFDDDPKET